MVSPALPVSASHRFSSPSLVRPAVRFGMDPGIVGDVFNGIGDFAQDYVGFVKDTGMQAITGQGEYGYPLDTGERIMAGIISAGAGLTGVVVPGWTGYGAVTYTKNKIGRHAFKKAAGQLADQYGDSSPQYNKFILDGVNNPNWRIRSYTYARVLNLKNISEDDRVRALVYMLDEGDEGLYEYAQEQAQTWLYDQRKEPANPEAFELFGQLIGHAPDVEEETTNIPVSTGNGLATYSYSYDEKEEPTALYNRIRTDLLNLLDSRA